MSALREDPRMSITAIAEQVDAPRGVISHHVDALLGSNTIRVVAAVNPLFLGQHVIAHVSIEPRGPAGPIAEFISQLEEAVLVTAVSGSHSVVAEVRLNSHSELHALLSRVRLNPSVARIDTVIYSTVRKGYHSHNAITHVRVDDADREIMAVLQQDGRASYTAISKHVALTPTTVRARIQRLVDAHVIRFGVVESRGTSGRQVSVGFGINSSDNLEPLMEHLIGHSGIEFAAECIGRFDVIGTCIGKDLQSIHTRLDGILALPHIDRLQTWTHLSTYKEDYSRRV